MILDWKKTVIVVAILATFVTLSSLGYLPKEGIVAGVSAILGWVGGWFTPSPLDKERHQVDILVTNQDGDQITTHSNKPN